MTAHDDIRLSSPPAQDARPAEGPLLQVDVSGRRGADGGDGPSYADRHATPGRAGRPGGDAALAQPGERAGTISIVIASDATPGQLRLTGQTTLVDGRARSLHEELGVGKTGRILLLARGGDGGRGGSGGDGETGGCGYDGADATAYSSGSNGGPGADGGDGGAATHGERGGDGGQIVVRVARDDTHLLMLVAHDVAEGRGGEAGTNGLGGTGGPGGRGGNSYSWTTTSTETYVDAQGQTQTRSVSHHHHNPGGMSGPPGRPGRDGPALVHAGADGMPGRFHIEVDDAGRVATFDRRYDVEIVDFQVELADAFAEPSSTVRLRRVVVNNAGGMPTPERFPPQIRLEKRPWLEPGEGELVLSGGLGAGQQFTWESESLSAIVPDIDRVPTGDPLRETEGARPLAWQPGAERAYANDHGPKAFPIAFAGEIEDLESLESQTPGRAALLRVTVVNNSRRGLGRESPSGRVVGLHIGLKSPELAEHLMLLDLDGRRLAWNDGFDIEIGSLDAGQTFMAEVIVGVLPGAPGYTQAELVATLRLGRLELPAEPRARHARVFPLRIAETYSFDPGAEMLLIANHGTTREEMAAWQAAADRLGKRLNVWDISLNDSLSLADVLAHGDNLLRDFHGKTILLANGAFETPLGAKHGDQFLGQMDLIKAAASHGIRFLVLNSAEHDVAHLFRERLVPTDGQPEFRYPSIAAFERSQPLDSVSTLLDQVRELVDHGAKAARPNPLDQTSEIAVYGLLSPNARRLRRQAARLQRKLENGSPGKRYVVVYQTAAAPRPGEPADEQEGVFFSYGRQGTLTVMPTVGDSQPNLVVLDAAESELHMADFLAGPRVAAAMTQSLSFADKVALLDRRLRELAETAETADGPEGGGPKRGELPTSTPAAEALAASMIDAVLLDLATEQAAVLKTGWQTPLFAKQIRASLEKLRYLADYPFALSLADGDRPETRLVARLLAGIEFLGRAACRWYEGGICPWRFFRRGPTLRRETLALARRIGAGLWGVTTPERRRLIDSRLAALAQRRVERRRHLPLTKKEAARRVLLKPLEDQQVRTDAGAKFPRVLSFDEWQAVRRAEDEREQARLTMWHEKERHRLDFLVARGGQPLPQVNDKIKAALAAFSAACRQVQPEAKAVPAVASGQPAITNVASAPLIEESPVTDQRAAGEPLARPAVAEIRQV